MELPYQIIIAFIAGGSVVWLLMDRQRQADHLAAQSNRLVSQSDRLASQADRILALEKVIATQRQKRGALYENRLEDLQAQHARVGRLLKLGLRDLVDAINQSSPGTLKEILNELDIVR